MSMADEEYVDELANNEFKRKVKLKIEAYGVKGMQSRQWRKIFKDLESLNRWIEKNDAEVYGTRDIEG